MYRLTDHKVLIIAEAGVNHNGSIETAKQLIDVAAEAGVDYVKFQTFKTEKLVARTAQMADYQKRNLVSEEQSQFEMIKKLELDADMHDFLIDHCKARGVAFLSTAFDLDSIDLLDELRVDVFKIPSGEITNKPYLRKIASKGKPIILSTGMATLGEVEDALAVLFQQGVDRRDIVVLHCNTEYPTPMADVNLRAMNTLADAFKVQVGYSDHTLGIEVPIAAVARGAVCIEKHFTLDRTMPGPDHRASLEPRELADMVSSIRHIEQALGSGIKQPSPSERKNIPIARKSIHTSRAIKAGEVLTAADLIMKRPGHGISPMDIDGIIGSEVARDIPADTILTKGDLKL